jgi:plastocyanin
LPQGRDGVPAERTSHYVAFVFAASLLVLTTFVHAQSGTDHSMHGAPHNMRVERDGAVMNENTETLPRGCDEISTDLHFSIHAGTGYALDFPGSIFGMSRYEVRVEPCSRLTVTFVNEDEVRHQWMVHGLPKYLYPAGMFHIEAAGGRTVTGTFIVPPEDRNYLIHCDLAQHMEKGMRGQLIVGLGSGDLWSVNGVSEFFLRDSYMPRNAWLAALAVLAALLFSIRFISRRTWF